MVELPVHECFLLRNRPLHKHAFHLWQCQQRTTSEDHIEGVSAVGSGWPFQFLPLRSSEGVERLHMFQKITLGQRKTSNGEEFEFVGMSNVSAKPPSGVVRASFQEIFRYWTMTAWECYERDSETRRPSSTENLIFFFLLLLLLLSHFSHVQLCAIP